MKDEDIQLLLQEMRDEAVPADSLVRFRWGLEKRIARRTRWRIATWVTAFAAIVLAIVLFPRPAALPPAPPRVEIAEAPLPNPQPAIRPAIHYTRRQTRPEYPQLAIRIETPDPDVVILLVGE